MAEAVHTAERLAELQALPLARKIQITQARIIEWYQRNNGDVYVSFSGGKDSTVLLHIVRQIYPDVPAVFSNTGLEYPEIQKFVKTFDNVKIVYPEINFTNVISIYGYPLIAKDTFETIYYARRIKGNTKANTGIDRYRNFLLGKATWNGERSQFNKNKWLPLARDIPVMISNRCCFTMKKSPIYRYQKNYGGKPILATLAEESRIRKQAWIRHGCNAFDAKKPKSQPMSFWTEQDVLSYIVKNQINIASVYGEIVSQNADGNEYPPADLTGQPLCNLKCKGCERTGCIYCGYGFHLDAGETRFQRLARTHPKQYEYSISGGQWVDNPAYDPAAPKMDGEWQNWNPKKIWVPSKQGLGMGKVFDMVNEIYGKDFYRYE